LDNFFCCEVKAGEYIMKQGDDASSFFVLQRGRIAVFING
jgi:cGMP-dependent protein kinase